MTKKFKGSQFIPKRAKIATMEGMNFELPNHSGDNSAGKVLSTPVNDHDIANKKYVDDNIGGGGVAAHNILDGSVHLDSVADGVTRGSLIYGNATPKWDELVVGAATAVLKTDGTDVSWGNVKLNEIDDPDGATAISMGSNDLKFQFSNPASDGFNIEGIGAFSGDLLHVHQHTGNPGAVNLVGMHAVDTDVTPLFIENAGGEIFKIDNSGNLTLSGTIDGIDVAARDHNAITLNASATNGGMSLATQEISNRAATNAQTGYATATHITSIEANTTHAANNTQAHSDYLINNGNDTTSGTLTWSGGSSTNANTAYTHSQNNTQAHSDYLLNSGTDTAVGPLKTTADNSSADTEYIPNVLYNTDATPPAANTVPIGTIYIQYTA